MRVRRHTLIGVAAAAVGLAVSAVGLALRGGMPRPSATAITRFVAEVPIVLLTDGSLVAVSDPDAAGRATISLTRGVTRRALGEVIAPGTTNEAMDNSRFVSLRSAGREPLVVLYQVGAPPSHRVIMSGRFGPTGAAISPDGSSILVESSHVLWACELATGRRTRLGSRPCTLLAVWSDGGRSISYPVYHSSSTAIERQAVGGGNPQVICNLGSARLETLSPGGAALLATRAGALWCLRLGDQTWWKLSTSKLAPGSHDFLWSRSGRLCAVLDRPDRRLLVVGVAAGRVVHSVRLPSADSLVSLFGWLPGESAITYTSAYADGSIAVKRVMVGE